MEPEGRRRRHRRSQRLERMMWGKCQGAAYSVSIFGSTEVRGGGYTEILSVWTLKNAFWDVPAPD